MLLRRIALALFALLLALMPLAPVPEFWITQANYIGLYALVAIGLVLLTGVAGLTSFGQAAVAGLGAYASAFLAVKMGISPWIGLLAGLGVTVVVALVGALGVGLLDCFGSFWASAFKEVIVFSSILPVLLWRSLRDPHGEEP